MSYITIVRVYTPVEGPGSVVTEVKDSPFIQLPKDKQNTQGLTDVRNLNRYLVLKFSKGGE